MTTLITKPLPQQVRVELLKTAIKNSPKQTYLKAEARDLGAQFGLVNGIGNDGKEMGHIEAYALVQLADEGYGYKQDIPNPRGKGKNITLFVKYC